MLRGGIFQIVFCKKDHVLLRDDRRKLLPYADDQGFYPVAVISEDKCNEVLLKYPRMVRFAVESFSVYKPTLQQVCTLLYYAKLLQRNEADASDPDSFCTWSKSLNETVFNRWNESFSHYRGGRVGFDFGVSARHREVLRRYSSEPTEDLAV